MRQALLAGLIVATVTALAAMDATLDPRAIQEAIAIGQTGLAQERERFQRGYRVAVSKPPVDYIEVVTPFRRVELAAEARAAAGDRSFGQRQALEALAAAPDRVDIYVELTFHPLNTYVGVPEYRVVMLRTGGTDALESAADETRIPRYGARVDSVPRPYPSTAGPARRGGSQPMLGGTVIAPFDVAALDDREMYDVVISEGNGRARREIARARVDLALLR